MSDVKDGLRMIVARPSNHGDMFAGFHITTITTDFINHKNTQKFCQKLHDDNN